MTAKELRQSLRRGNFVYPFLGVHVLAVMATIFDFYAGNRLKSSEYAGALNLWLLVSSGAYWGVVSLICLVWIPLCGSVLMKQELDQRNYELLLLTPLSRWRIVFGKFFALWGLSVLTFISLLPYGVARFMLGAIEWWHEAACSGTILGGSAILCAGAIGVSGFSNGMARIGVGFLYCFSMFIGSAITLISTAMVSGGCGWFYHFTALWVIVAYVVVGMALARSRLRSALIAYEVNPSSLILGLLVFSPFAVGLIIAIGAGWSGFVCMMILGFIVRQMDIIPSLPNSRLNPPVSNVPTKN